jgi:hypothetical protein
MPNKIVNNLLPPSWLTARPVNTCGEARPSMGDLMIVSTFGRYLSRTAHDHETRPQQAWWERYHRWGNV